MIDTTLCFRISMLVIWILHSDGGVAGPALAMML